MDLPACPIASGFPTRAWLHQFRHRLGVAGLRRINDQLRHPLIQQAARWNHAVALIDATDLEAACNGFKKKEATPIPRTAPGWGNARSKPDKALGMLATRSTACVCGGANMRPRSCLVPLVSWVTPGNFFEGKLLAPSLHYCQQRWQWWPKIVVGDMSFMGAQLKALCRTRWEVAVITRLRSDMTLPAPYQTWNQTVCHQGQPLRWLEYQPQQRQH